MSLNRVSFSVRLALVACSAGLLSGCAGAAAADGCDGGQALPALSVDGKVVARHDCGAPLGGERGVVEQAKVGQVIRVTMPGVDANRLHSSSPFTLQPNGDGVFKAAGPGWASIFIAVRPGENCVQPPHACNLFDIQVRR